MSTNPSRQVSIDFQPGDTVDVRVQSQGREKFEFTLKDERNGRSSILSDSCPAGTSCDTNTVIWTAEAFNVDTHPLPVPDIGPVVFGNDQVTQANGNSVSLGNIPGVWTTLEDISATPGQTGKPVLVPTMPGPADVFTILRPNQRIPGN